MKTILFVLLLSFTGSLFAQITTIPQLFASYKAAGPTTIVQGNIDWFFAQNPTVDDIIAFADMDTDKYKVRNAAITNSRIKTPADFLRIYSGIGEMSLAPETIKWVMTLNPTIDQIAALGALELDKFKVANIAFEKNLIKSTADLIKLYSRAAPVQFYAGAINQFVTAKTTVKDGLDLAKISVNKSEILRKLYQLRIITLTDVLTNSELPKKLQDFRAELKTDRGVSALVKAATSPYTATEIENRLFAVHATNFFPQNNMIRVVHPKERQESSFFRPTTHFALGELVRPHTNGTVTWDNKKFAIVTPVKDIMLQMINLNTYDTFILGNFRLTPDSTVIYPVGSESLITPGLNGVAFDPRVKTLRTAIEEVIRSKNGFTVRMKEDNTQVSEAIMNGKNINSISFFSPLLQKYPYASFGSHMESIVGEGYDYGYIDMFMSELSLGDVYQMGTSSTKSYILSLVDFILNDARRDILQSQAYGPSAKKIFNDHAEVATAKLEELKTTIPFAASGKSYLSTVALRAAVLSPARLKNFILLYPEQFTDVNLPLFATYYYFYRTTNIGKEVASAEGTWAAFQASYDGLSAGEKTKLLGEFKSYIQYETTSKSIFVSDLNELISRL